MNNLSTGAVIGLAVGAGVGVLLALAIAILVTRRNRRRARGSGRSKNNGDAGSVGGSGRSLHSGGSRRGGRGIDDQPEASTVASRIRWPISISTVPKKEEAARNLNPSDNTSPPLIPFILPTFLTASRRSQKSSSTHPTSTVSSFHRPPSTEPLAPRSPGGSDATSPIIQGMPSPVPSDVSNPHSIPLSIAPTAATINRPFVAVFVYKAQRPDEFSVTVGDVLTVLEKYPDGWCTARKMDRDGTERLGVVPFGALKALTSLDSDRDRRSSGLPHVPPKA
ncbi:hypothetical protein M427DRAFT_133638 [Gonapodya prolifera JEL478]|uniref:SH3 domain-containing protein n=1 Tax=Gonapodya prolifera (strain JEL478) TaxID=1344416 RepID=A0A139ALA0_GONPJ|nr:hypothetical protein M427DRAFT_133638 [Gonapodya prolifera JEL478]|eukprot:KXS17195.1 hypothetical protein M427DRAFT_133638 [Gonapodya prolifera JEL478]